jgi:hypothetical protein
LKDLTTARRPLSFEDMETPDGTPLSRPGRDHTIISWDCCYRNFFHTAYALSEQSYDPDEFEVIYVEQRTKEASDRFNHQFGLPALGDVVRDLQSRINIRALYLGDDEDEPLHWGRAVNHGIGKSTGAVISVMDGDILVENDFLTRLDEEHGRSEPQILNLHRRMVQAPLRVPRAWWMKQRVDFRSCLEACPDRYDPIPAVANNYGPMISAGRSLWEAIGGYDEHPIWATGLSRIGEDTTRRLEIEAGDSSRVLPRTVSVHPWHPAGFRRDTFAGRRILSLQGQLVDWAREHKTSHWKERLPVTTVLFNENRRFMERMISSDVANPSINPSASRRALAWMSGVAARLRNREFRELRGQLGTVIRGLKRRGNRVRHDQNFVARRNFD